MDMVDPHVKSFLNLNCYEEQQKNIISIHAYGVKDNVFGVNNKKIELRNNSTNHVALHFKDCDMFVAHFYFQSKESYMKRKINLPRDDMNVFRDKESSLNVFECQKAWSAQNTILVSRYSAKIKNFLIHLDNKKKKQKPKIYNIIWYKLSTK